MKKEITEKILEQTKDNYNQIAEHFSSTRAWLWKITEEFISYLKPGSKILDIGCGNGRLFELFRDKNVAYFGIDNSQKLIEIAKKKYVICDPTPEVVSNFNTQTNKPRFFIADALNLPFKDDDFDAIFMIAVLPHIPSRELQIKVLNEVNRVLKKDGFLFVTCWNLWQPKILFNNFFNRAKRPKFYQGFGWNDFLISWTTPDNKKIWRFYHAFTQKELKKLLWAGNFNIKKICYEYRGEKSTWLKGFNLIAVAQKI